jgi:hypothetical protein
MNNETYELLTTKFDSLPTIEVENLSISFFDLSEGDYSSLLDNEIDTPKAIEIEKDGISLNLKKICYIESIRLIPPLETDLKDVDLVYFDINQNKKFKSKKADNKSGFLEYEINDFIRKIHIYDSSWVRFFETKPAIIRVTIKGIPSSNISEIVSNTRKILDFQSDFQKLILDEQSLLKAKEDSLNKKEIEFEEKIKNDATQKVNDIQAHNLKVAELQKTIVALQKTLKEEEAKIEVKTTEIASIQTQIDQKTLENQKVEENFKLAIEKEKKSSTINKELIENNKSLETKANILRDELLKLSNDKSLFTEDIQGHFREGFKQIRMYLIVAGIPIIASVAMAISIFFNADNITNLFKEKPELGILNLLASRLPYTTVSLALIAFFTKVVTVFVNRIIEIHEKRLRFSEIGILTKDTSDAVLSGSQLPDKARLQLRLGIRMKLIREYISGKYDFESKDTDQITTLLTDVQKDLEGK